MFADAMVPSTGWLGPSLPQGRYPNHLLHVNVNKMIEPENICLYFLKSISTPKSYKTKQNQMYGPYSEWDTNRCSLHVPYVWGDWSPITLPSVCFEQSDIHAMHIERWKLWLRYLTSLLWWKDYRSFVTIFNNIVLVEIAVQSVENSVYYPGGH